MNKLLMACASLAMAVSASPAAAQAALDFQIVGDTISQPFTITNSSLGGIRVTGFGVTLVSPFGFDTVANPPGVFGFNDAQAFTPDPVTAAGTGYTGPLTVTEGSNTLNFTFTGFDPGESFSWLIDVDSTTAATVIGNELIGSTGYADFSNGLRGTGSFVALGSNGAQFRITAFAPTPGVPEPATWALMIGGFGMTGAAMRRARHPRRAALA